MELIIGRLLRADGDNRQLRDLPASALAVEAATMEDFLQGLDEIHGGARSWAEAAGVPVGTLDAMCELLVPEPDRG
jgi:hypothetical protein